MIVPIRVLDIMKPFNFKSMYELGNKKAKGQPPYRIYYKAINVEYTSIDLNGMDGAIKLDLRKPIDLPSRDMVANIGTAEHIMDQEAVFRNIHNLSHFRMVHWSRQAKLRPRHGCWGYEKDFFIMLAKLNDYVIEKLYINKKCKYICCSYKKINNNNFIWNSKLPLFRNKHGSRGVKYR